MEGKAQHMPGKDVIGWIGLGHMGSRMAPRLLAAGHPVVAYDTDAGRLESLAALGGTPVAGIADLAGRSRIVVSSVPGDAALLDVVLGREGLAAQMEPGSCLIDMSTVSPAASAEAAASLGARGIDYLRAPVSGSTVLAAAGTLSIFVSGDSRVFETHRALLGLLGRTVSHVGPGEAARVVKLVVNLIVAVTNGALAEALSFGHRQGLDWDTMIDTVAASVAASPFVLSKVDTLKRRDWTAAAPVALIAKDTDLALDAGRRVGAYMPLAATVRQMLAAVEGQGNGGLDMAAVVTLFDALAPTLNSQEE